VLTTLATVINRVFSRWKKENLAIVVMEKERSQKTLLFALLRFLYFGRLKRT
jgi:hypothetical protein